MISDSNKLTSEKNKKAPVYLNIYDFWSCFNCIFAPIGFGVYHTGIQIFDDEYMFFGFDGDQTGVGYIQPFTAAYTFSEQILLGYTNYTFFQFDQKILDPLRLQFTGNKYDLLANNCNHFAKRLAKDLNFQEKFPKKIFKITDFCNLFRCCIPQCILNGRLDWFNSNQSDEENDYAYQELRQSVKQQDIKMISSQSKKNGVQQLQIYKNIRESKIEYLNLHNLEHSKNTTLRKGIWPHTQHSYEKLNKSRSSVQEDKQIKDSSPLNNVNQTNKFIVQEN